MDYIFSLVLGAAIGAGFICGISSDHRKAYFEAKPLIEQCESDLPRSQTCKIIAVVNSTELGEQND